MNNGDMKQKIVSELLKMNEACESFLKVINKEKDFELYCEIELVSRIMNEISNETLNSDPRKVEYLCKLLIRSVHRVNKLSNFPSLKIISQDIIKCLEGLLNSLRFEASEKPKVNQINFIEETLVYISGIYRNYKPSEIQIIKPYLDNVFQELSKIVADMNTKHMQSLGERELDIIDKLIVENLNPAIDVLFKNNESSELKEKVYMIIGILTRISSFSFIYDILNE